MDVANCDKVAIVVAGKTDSVESDVTAAAAESDVIAAAVDEVTAAATESDVTAAAVDVVEEACSNFLTTSEYRGGLKINSLNQGRL